MAEFVEYRLEERLPELLQMQKSGLFEIEEVKSIANKRKQFEYKIQKRTKCKNDYQQYIQYEMDLLALISCRKIKAGHPNKMLEMEKSIVNHVTKLFNLAVERFSSDTKLWLAFIDFCKTLKYASSVSRILTRMLQVHQDKPKLWLFAANLEWKEHLSIENGRKLLLRALQFHPKSSVLYLAGFEMELEYANELYEAKVQEVSLADDKTKIFAAKNLESDPVITGNIAELFYNAALKEIMDVEVFVKMLHVARQYDFTRNLQSKILNDLMKNYSVCEMTYHTVAQLELEGATTSTCKPQKSEAESDDEEEEKEEKPDVTNKMLPLKERVRRMCAIYLAGTSKVPTKRMWDYYLKAVVDLDQILSGFPVFKKKITNAAFREANLNKMLNADQFITWVNISEIQGRNKAYIAGILQSATEQFSSNVELWEKRLTFHMGHGDDEAADIFKESVSAIGIDNTAVVPLCRTIMKHYQGASDEKLEQILQDLIGQRSVINSIIGPVYLEWLSEEKGIVAARRLYSTLALQPPFLMELHEKMIDLESQQPQPKAKHLRKCYELATFQFGKTKPDLWMDYIKFEWSSNNSKIVSSLYERALKTLEPAFQQDFVQKFCLLKTSFTDINSFKQGFVVDCSSC